MTEQTNDTQEVLTATGILSYAFLATPFSSTSDDGSTRLVFKTSVILEPTSADVEKIKTASRRIAANAWKDPTVLARIAAQDKLALHSGDLQTDEAYKGKVFITCNSKKQPTIVATLGGAALQAAIDAETDPAATWLAAARAALSTNQYANAVVRAGHAYFPYSGCKAAVQFALYAQSPDRKPVKHGARLNCQLQGVQFLAHGKAFGGGGGRVAQVSEFGINPLDADAAIPAAQTDLGNAGGLY